MLGAVDLDAAGLGQRGADGVGAALLLVPAGAGQQRHTLGLAQEVGVAQGVHQHAVAVGQHHHAVAVPHLLEQVFHHRLRVPQQVAVQGQHTAQLGVGQVVGRMRVERGQARRHAAAPRAGDTLVDRCDGCIDAFQQPLARLAQHRPGDMGCNGHLVSWGLVMVAPHGKQCRAGLWHLAVCPWVYQGGVPFLDRCAGMQRSHRGFGGSYGPGFSLSGFKRFGRNFYVNQGFADCRRPGGTAWHWIGMALDKERCPRGLAPLAQFTWFTLLETT